jgi:hypothetical protein
VATNLHSPSGKTRQGSDWLWLGLVEPEIWSLGLNGPGSTRQKEPGCTCTHCDHTDVPQREVLLHNTSVLAMIVTLMFTGTHFNNVIYFH